MSLEAMLWVMNRAPAKNHSEMAVLYALANNADHEGRGSWPSQQTIAERSLCTTRTVKRHLAAMEERGVIRRGDQRAVKHLRADRRPVVWDLNLSLTRGNETDSTGGQNVTPQRSEGTLVVATGGQPGLNEGTLVVERGDTAMSYKPSRTQHEPNSEPTPYSPPASEPTGSAYPAAFEDWYATYPVHKDKPAAFKAWLKVVAKIGETNLMQALVDRLPQIRAAVPYIKYPATWLNKGGWEDDIEEPAVQMSQQDQRRAKLIAAAQQLNTPGQETRHEQHQLG